MAERYTRLYSLQENLYQEGSPILISAGALLKDNSTGKLLVQLKFRNISNYVINAVKVKINAFDPAGTELKGIESFSYLDLSVEEDGEFGQQKPLPLPDVTTRSFSVEILYVTYSGGCCVPKENAATRPASQDVMEMVQKLDKRREKKREDQSRKEKRYKDIIKKYSLWSIFPLILSLISFAFRHDSIRNLLHSSSVVFDFLILAVMLLCIRISPKIKRAPVIGIMFVTIISILEIGFFSTDFAGWLSWDLWYWRVSWLLGTSLRALGWRLRDVKDIVSVIILITFDKKIKALEET